MFTKKKKTILIQIGGLFIGSLITLLFLEPIFALVNLALILAGYFIGILKSN